MDTIFTVKNEELERLSSTEAVNFFRKLLWAEAQRIGVPLSKIRISSRVTVPDGGIDASVDEHDGLLSSGLIMLGNTGYQIKTGNDFKPWQPAQLKQELFGKDKKSRIKEINKNNLGDSVRTCLDKNGTYIIVCFGQDIVESEYIKTTDELKSYLEQCGYTDPKVNVWSQNQLIGFLEPFPSLRLELKGLSALGFQSYRDWAMNEDMTKEFIQSPDYASKEELIQETIRSADEATHIRIIAESGAGKTKFILEATGAKDIAPLVIYTKADQFIGSPLLTYLSRKDNSFYVVLVVDECDERNRINIWNVLKKCRVRLKLITINNQGENREYDINYIDTPELSIDEIREIILTYDVPRDRVERWAELAGSSPRFAHMIGINLKLYPDDVLRPVEDIYDRIIAGYDNVNSEDIKRRKRVILFISLFKRFGYRMPVDGEAKAIAKIIEKNYSDITWGRFREIIKELQDIKILQGVNTLYITPKALHIRMWSEWWDIYGNSFSLDEFLADIPEISQLQEWFYEMFVYAAESEGAARVVKLLLSSEGPFHDDHYLRTKLGAQFFFALTQADPKSALQFLKKTISRLSKDELLQFTTGRRAVVGALERIAVWRSLFLDAARLLLRLGEAENERWSNNASGIFIELFSFGYGQVASTEASPKERFPVLREALESKSKEQRDIALRACNRALESQHWTRTVGAEYQGLRKEPELWMAKTYGELWDVYFEVWQLLRERLDTLSEDEQRKVADIFLNRARALGQIQYLANTVIDTISEVARKPYADGRKVLHTITTIIRYSSEEISLETKQRWEQLKEQLLGNDFHSLMKRYISMSFLLKDELDEQGNRVNQVELKIQKLAQQGFLNQPLLEAELSWLMTTETHNVYVFGYKLGRIDKNFTLLPKLINAQRNVLINTSINFLSGYFHALFEENKEEWENQLDTLSGDESFNVWIPELTRRSGQSNRAASRILNLAKKGFVSIDKLGEMRGSVQNMSEDIFVEWIDFLLSSSHECSASIILNLYSSHYIHQDYYRKEVPYTMPQKQTFRVLIHYLNFQEYTVSKDYEMDDYLWSKIGKYFVQLYPKNSIELADEMLKHFSSFDSILQGSDTQNLLNLITKEHPQQVWQLVTKYIEQQSNSQAFYINQWLRGDKSFPTSQGENYEWVNRQGMLAVMPPEKVWEWIDEDVETRARYLASFVPKMLFREEGKICFARELLVRYGEREDVRNNLIANFSTGGWIGSASQHYQESKERLLDFTQGENDEKVQWWIDDYVSRLEQDVERAKIEEERRGF